MTLDLYRHPDLFRLCSVTGPSEQSRYRLTVDTEDDFRLVEAVFDELHPRSPEFGIDHILAFLCSRPDLAMLKDHVQQKPSA